MRTSHVPMRACLACGKKAPKRGMVRVVRTTQGGVEIDFKGKKAGRGAYLCGNLDCWDKGLEKGSLDRALRISVSKETKEDLKVQFEARRDMAVGERVP